ncbi:GNAT family N-acetyltransferase [Geodermatophilus sp. SYSU D00758]
MTPAGAVRLRVPTDADAASWSDLFADPAVMRYVGTGEVRDPAWYAAFVRRQQELARETRLCLWSVLVEDRVVGFAGIQPWPQPWGPRGESEIGWRLGRRSWGRGYATTAARIALHRAREVGLPRVVALVHADNTPSLAVAGRLGMTEEAVLRAPGGAPVRQFGLVLGG